jgi:hypothetical protein
MQRLRRQVPPAVAVATVALALSLGTPVANADAVELGAAVRDAQAPSALPEL